MRRTVRPELLDDLPPDDAGAQESRRDLVSINRLMGNYRWFARRLPRLARPGERALEVGAGGGELHTFMPAAVAIDGLDRWPAPPAWPARARWHQTDVFAFSGWADYGIVLGNFFFHHFSAEQLAQLGDRIRPHARVILINEPTRSRICQSLFVVLSRLLRTHPVTRHDGYVSIAAGFRKGDLPNLFQLDRRNWSWKERETTRGAYRLEAVRAT